MKIRLSARTGAALLAAALACGCNTPPPTPEQAERRCQSMRNYMPARPYYDVLQGCMQQMTEADCKKCLDR